MTGTNFKKGDYVVLLSTCTGNDDTWGDSIPVGYCYKLREDSSQYAFYIEKDTAGAINGWSLGTGSRGNRELGHLLLRTATPEEIAEYNRMDRPFKVKDLEPKILTDYEIC